ncbi:MAG TPA: hypothetical protein VGK17_17850 [Propionicimonas sp.]|jgi:hypothetical protein
MRTWLLAALVAVVAAGCGHVGEKQISVAKHGERGCNANDVKLAINPGNRGFAAQLDRCASPSWGKTKESALCLARAYPGLSESCVMCFAQMAHCTARNCKLACMTDHHSEKCLKCAESNCRDLQRGTDFSLETCTGLQAAELPPRKK